LNSFEKIDRISVEKCSKQVFEMFTFFSQWKIIEGRK